MHEDSASEGKSDDLTGPGAYPTLEQQLGSGRDGGLHARPTEPGRELASLAPPDGGDGFQPASMEAFEFDQVC